MTSNNDGDGCYWPRYEAVDLDAQRIRRDWADLDDQAHAPAGSPKAQHRGPVTLSDRSETVRVYFVNGSSADRAAGNLGPERTPSRINPRHAIPHRHDPPAGSPA